MDLVESGTSFDPKDVKGFENHIQSIQVRIYMIKEKLLTHLPKDIVNTIVIKGLYSDSIIDYEPIPKIVMWVVRCTSGSEPHKSAFVHCFFGQNGYIKAIDYIFTEVKSYDSNKKIDEIQRYHDQLKIDWIDYLSGKLDAPYNYKTGENPEWKSYDLKPDYTRFSVNDYANYGEFVIIGIDQLCDFRYSIEKFNTYQDDRCDITIYDS
jgi:hypothetical protein